MEMIACQCDDLPAHDHYMGQELDEKGRMGPRWDPDDIGRLWVDWKAVARALRKVRCPICGGFGKIWCLFPQPCDGDDLVCRECNGTGEVDNL